MHRGERKEHQGREVTEKHRWALGGIQTRELCKGHDGQQVNRRKQMGTGKNIGTGHKGRRREGR